MGRPKGTNNKVKDSFTIESGLWNRLKAEGKGKASSVVNEALKFWYETKDKEAQEAKKAMEVIRELLRQEQTNETAKQLVGLVGDNEEARALVSGMLPWFGMFVGLCNLKYEQHDDVLGEGDLIQFYWGGDGLEMATPELHIENDGRLVLCFDRGQGISMDVYKGETQAVELPANLSRYDLESVHVAQAVHGILSGTDPKAAYQLQEELSEAGSLDIWNAKSFFTDRDFLDGVEADEEAIKEACRKEFEDCAEGNQVVIGLEEFVEELQTQILQKTAWYHEGRKEIRVFGSGGRWIGFDLEIMGDEDTDSEGLNPDVPSNVNGSWEKEGWSEISLEEAVEIASGYDDYADDILEHHMES
mgnify:CR=1 FL=1